MSRTSSQKAAAMVGNRFNLILIAAQRSRELRAGTQPLVESKTGPALTALAEIEAGKIGVEVLKRVPLAPNRTRKRKIV